MDYITEFAKNKPTTPTSEVHNAIYEARGTAPELLIIIILLVHVFLQSYYIYFTLVQLVSFFCLSFTFGALSFAATKSIYLHLGQWLRMTMHQK
jgi:hypothetical protein